MYEYGATLKRIVDSDTIDVDIDLGFEIHLQAQVKLSGITTPNSRSRDEDEKKRGLAAKQRLQDLLEQAKGEQFSLRTELDGNKTLGTILIGGMNLNRTLVQEGHATESTVGKKQ